jgi:1-acyl-sn-glycerol-3-phosphate acyltransferase
MRVSTGTGKLSLLRNANFVLLWCAYGVSVLGDHLAELALLKTQRAIDADVDITPLAARMTMMFFLPMFLFAPISGALADRLPRRGLMVFADGARVIVMLAFASLLAWSAGWGRWGAFAPLLLLGMFASVFSPARAALLPTIVRDDQLVRANAMISGLGIIATMAAALLGGHLAKHYEPRIAFFADAGTFLLSAVFLLAIRPPARTVAPTTSSTFSERFGRLKQGFSYAFAHRHVRELIAVAALVWFCGSFVLSVLPAVVRDCFGGDLQTIGFYKAIIGAGFVTGSLTLLFLGDALRPELAITWGCYGVALGLTLLAGSAFLDDTTIAAFVGGAGMFLSGTFGVTVMASVASLIQKTVADRYRGRVFGVSDVCTSGALLAATGFLGVPQWERVDRWVGWILIVVAVLMFAAGIMTLVVRLRRAVYGPMLLFLQNLNEFLTRFWYRFKRIGPCTLPQTGAAIVTCNHVCSADPLLLCAAAKYRPISFMIAAEYAKLPIVHWVVSQVDCIPVRRGSRDTSSTKQAIRNLKDGRAMGIFIEGGIVAPTAPIRLKDGVAMLALRTGAKVIPVYLTGVKHHDDMLHGLFARQNARATFGPPVDLSDLAAAAQNRDTTRKATRRIYDAILALAPEDERNDRLARLVTPETRTGSGDAAE